MSRSSQRYQFRYNARYCFFGRMVIGYGASFKYYHEHNLLINRCEVLIKNVLAFPVCFPYPSSCKIPQDGMLEAPL